ncbi:unnamed protein product [Urochloa humidicola]
MIGTQEAPGPDWSSQEDGGVPPTDITQAMDGELPKEPNKIQRSPRRDSAVEEMCQEKVIHQMGELQAEQEDVVSSGNQPSHPLESRDEKNMMQSSFGEQEGAQQQEVRQSSRLKAQGFGGIKIADKAKLATMKKNLEGLQKGEVRQLVEQGAEAMKTSAMMFHPQAATTSDTGVVLLQ